MHSPTGPGLILILIVALLLFGPSKLPDLGRALGETFRSFKDAMAGKDSEESKDENQEKKV